MFVIGPDVPGEEPHHWSRSLTEGHCCGAPFFCAASAQRCGCAGDRAAPALGGGSLALWVTTAGPGPAGLPVSLVSA